MPYKKRKAFGKKRAYGGKKRRGKRLRRGRRRGKGNNTISIMKKITEPMKYTQNFGFRPIGSSTTANSQYAFYLCSWNDAADISTLHNTIQSQINAPTTSPLTKFAVGKFKGEYMIKSENNMDTFVTFYKVMARDDMDSELIPVIGYTPSGIIKVSDAIDVLCQSYAESAIASKPLRQTFPLGITPYDCNKFCTYFKIVGKPKTVKITGGGYTVVRVKDNKWRLWNGSKVAGCTGATNAQDVVFRKRTMWIIGFAVGLPTVDSSEGSAPGKASHSGIDLAITTTEKYYVTAVPNAQAKIIAPVNDFVAFTGVPSTILEQTEVKSGVIDA